MQHVLSITHNSNAVLLVGWKSGQSHLFSHPLIKKKTKKTTHNKKTPNKAPYFQSDKGIPVLSLHMKDLTAILPRDHSCT